MHHKSTIAVIISLFVVGVLAQPTTNPNDKVDIFNNNLQKIFDNHPLYETLTSLEKIPVPKKCKKSEALNQEISSKIIPRSNNEVLNNENDSNCEFAEILVPKCGIRNPNGLGARLMNGQESEVYEFPWIVALLKVQKNPTSVKHLFICAGSLIHPSVILTIAHCVQRHKNDAANLKIRAGEWDFSTAEEMLPAQDRVASKIIVHEKFNKGSMVNDIALVILAEPYSLHKNINPICLPNPGFNFDYKTCTTAGWGKDKMKGGTYSPILNKIDLPIVPNDQCQESLRTELGQHYKLNPSFLCAGGEIGIDTCLGDGGSPLNCPIFGKKNQYYQIGSVSWGVGCGGATPGVYSNMMNLRDWVDAKMIAEGFSTDYYTNI